MTKDNKARPGVIRPEWLNMIYTLKPEDVQRYLLLIVRLATNSLDECEMPTEDSALYWIIKTILPSIAEAQREYREMQEETKKVRNYRKSQAERMRLRRNSAINEQLHNNDVTPLHNSYVTITAHEAKDATAEQVINSEKKTEKKEKNKIDEKKHTNKSGDLCTHAPAHMAKVLEIDNNNPQEKTKRKKEDPKSLEYGEFDNLIPNHLRTLEFRVKWKEWEDYRRKRRKKISLEAAARQFRMLQSKTSKEACEMIDYSIMNDYQGLFDRHNRPILGRVMPTERKPGF